MKKQFFLIVATMLASTLLLAQTNNNVDEVVKIEQHAARAYREGELIVKFKPTSAVQMRSLKHSITSNTNTVDKVFGELGITAGEALMPLTGAEVVPGARALRSISGKLIHNSDMSNLYRLTFDGSKMNVFDAVEKMAALNEVEYAEPNYLVYSLSSNNMLATDKPNDPLGDEQWGNGQLKLDFLWKQKPITDKRPIIAILDTGVDIEHPDLKDNIWTNEVEQSGAEDEDDDANGFADDLHGWDFVNQTGRLGDWNGHGTHCAGIAAAVGDNKIGITGANPYALIMPITVMQSDGTGDVATIIKGIDYAAANGANVISMSIGGYGYSLAEEQALAKAYNKAVLVAAAGNDNKCIDAHDCPVNEKGAMQNGPMYPAAFTFVLGVEASTKDGGLASFSNFDEDGPVFSAYNEEQLYNYELRAPGAQIMSTFPGGKYKKLNGTSMACPYVAGGISRLLQIKEYGNWEILFGDLIHARKHRCEHEHDENVDFEAVYKITDEDRKPVLSLVTYTLDDAEGGDGDTKPDAGETIAFYPTLRNEWGQAENIRFSLELTEAEDSTIVEFLDDNADFGKQLSSYGKNISANPIRFKVREDCTDGRKICMVFRATCDNISEELEQEITLTAENGVEIGGVITEDMTLYPNVHYIVTRTLAVPKGVTLTILPGTILKFKDNAGFNPYGNLVCDGTPEQPIIFTQADKSSEISTFFRFTSSDTITYTIIENFSLKGTLSHYGFISNGGVFENCIIKDIKNDKMIYGYPQFIRSNIYQNNASDYFDSSGNVKRECNYVNNLSKKYSTAFSNFQTCNIFNDFYKDRSTPFYVCLESDLPEVCSTRFPCYFGSTREDIVRLGIFDAEHKTNPLGSQIYDLSNMLTCPTAEAHAVVWKVVVNGYDAQDEFEVLPPLGVGKHKFEVYFNRPMDKNVVPMIAMGVRPPYTFHSIAEDGAWNEDGTIYTAYLTIDGKTGADGLNRIYVAGAIESSKDYYLRKELQQLSSKTENIFQEVANKPKEVLFQHSDPSKVGYLTCIGKDGSNANTISRLYDGDTSYGVGCDEMEYIQVDLGINNSSRFIRFGVYHYGSDYEKTSPEKYFVQGSNDGVDFIDICTISIANLINNKFWNSLVIDSHIPYRYYRFSNSTSDVPTEFTMEVLDNLVKENYVNLLSDVESSEILANLALGNNLLRVESRNNNLLQSVIDQMYIDYNKLATILHKPIIEQKPVEVPSTPMWEIPVENTRFNVEVAAAGSMATGLMAEAGLGKVTLTWETDEEDFADLLGYNIYRYSEVDDSTQVMDYNKYGDYKYHWEYFTRLDTVIINSTVLESDETTFTDFDIVPGTTYYYYIKQLTTSLTSHALSNAVAATPLTAQKGDANGSMTVDIADLVTEVAYITYQNPQPFIFEAADVNSDQKVNVLDVVGTISIIANPTGAGISSVDNEPVRYYVKDGILYVETAQALGGVQVRLHAEKGTEITAQDGLRGMEQTSVWTSDSEFLFLAYSMSGRTLAPGTHALLKIGNEALITEMVISDSKGRNVPAMSDDATGIGVAKQAQLQVPSPNPFTTQLNVPYIIGMSGEHNVTLTFSDLAGRVIDTYNTVSTQGENSYTWKPGALQRGMYFVTLHVDGKFVQTAKVVCNN